MHSQDPHYPYPPEFFRSPLPPSGSHSCGESTAAPTGSPDRGNHYYPQEGYASSPSPAGRFGGWFEFSSSGYLKGFLIGAGATLVLTNPTVQKALVRGTVKVWSLLQGGVEEMKEQFRDVKAEMSEEKQA